jgi:hypothetical protein
MPGDGGLGATSFSFWQQSTHLVASHSNCANIKKANSLSDFDLLLADVETHFQALTQTPADVLRHIGSPFAPDTSRVRSQADAA